MSTTETEYVPRELFEIHLQSIRERANSDKELGDERLEKFQAVMEKNFATLQGQINVLSEKIDHVADTLNEKIERVESTINKRIDGLEETIGVAIQGTHERIDGLEKRIDDQKHYMNVWFAVLAAIPIAIAIVQHIIAK